MLSRLAFLSPLVALISSLACSPSTATPCSARRVETEHRVAGTVSFRAEDGTTLSGTFDSNRTDDENEPHDVAMQFEDIGPVTAAWSAPTSDSPSLYIQLESPRDGALQRLDGGWLILPAVPSSATPTTMDFANGEYCYCPGDRRYPSVDGCVAGDPGYSTLAYDEGDGVVCEPVSGSFEVKTNEIECDDVSAILPPACSGDFDLTVTIPSRSDRRFAATLHVVEHSRHTIVYCGVL